MVDVDARRALRGSLRQREDALNFIEKIQEAESVELHATPYVPHGDVRVLPHPQTALAVIVFCHPDREEEVREILAPRPRRRVVRRLSWKHLVCLAQAAHQDDASKGAPYGVGVMGCIKEGAEVNVQGPRGQFIRPREAFLVLDNLVTRGLVERDEVAFVYTATDLGKEVLAEELHRW